MGLITNDTLDFFLKLTLNLVPVALKTAEEFVNESLFLYSFLEQSQSGVPLSDDCGLLF